MKTFRTKSSAGGLGVRLDRITAIEYTLDGEGCRTEISTTEGPKDTVLTMPELEALLKAWEEAL